MMVETRAADGVLLSALVQGPPDAPALLLLQSLGTDHQMWAPQIAALSDRFRIVALDTRGHGASEAPDGDYTIDRLGHDALAMLDQLGIGAAHVCGLSLGGMMAQWLAAHAPDRVARLVLANTAGRIGTAAAWQARIDSVRRDGMDSIAEAVLARFFGAGFRTAHPGTDALFRQRLVATAVQGYGGCCAALRDADLRPMLGIIRARTLVIGGLSDVSTPPADADFLARGIPHAELMMLEAAHLSNIEQPASFTAALAAFLERD